MLGRTYENQVCSAARALEVIGERWSLLIIRDAMFGGITKFSDFQRNLDIAPNTLTSRLDGFVAANLMESRRYSDQYNHHEYVLTDKGRELQPVIIALTAWGDRWAAPDGPPIVYLHQDCGERVDLQLRCESCRTIVQPTQVEARPSPAPLATGRLSRSSSSRSENRSTKIVPEREGERVFTADPGARTATDKTGRRVGRPVAHSAEKVEYARLLKAQGASYGEISAKTGIPKTSLHRHLARAPRKGQ